MNLLYSQSIKDTLFFHREKNDTNYQVIFINSPLSVYHEKVFKLLLSDKSSYYDKLNILDSLTVIKNKKFRSDFIGDWISIYSFKGKNYAYSPSEPFFNLFIRITDSTVVTNDFNDGLTPYFIKGISNKNNEHVFKIVSSNSKEYTLTFSLKKDAVVVKSTLFRNREIRMANKKSFFNLPIIVNFCPSYRCKEFNFK